jgi:hypothetical protein
VTTYVFDNASEHATTRFASLEACYDPVSTRRLECSPGGDELTRTQKLRHKLIAARYVAEIDAMYAADWPSPRRRDAPHRRVVTRLTHSLVRSAEDARNRARTELMPEWIATERGASEHGDANQTHLPASGPARRSRSSQLDCATRNRRETHAHLRGLSWRDDRCRPHRFDRSGPRLCGRGLDRGSVSTRDRLQARAVRRSGRPLRRGQRRRESDTPGGVRPRRGDRARSNRHAASNKPTGLGLGNPMPQISCRKGATSMSTKRNGSTTGYDGEHRRPRRGRPRGRPAWAVLPALAVAASSAAGVMALQAGTVLAPTPVVTTQELSESNGATGDVVCLNGQPTCLTAFGQLTGSYTPPNYGGGGAGASSSPGTVIGCGISGCHRF